MLITREVLERFYARAFATMDTYCNYGNPDVWLDEYATDEALLMADLAQPPGAVKAVAAGQAVRARDARAPPDGIVVEVRRLGVPIFQADQLPLRVVAILNRPAAGQRQRRPQAARIVLVGNRFID